MKPYTKLEIWIEGIKFANQVYSLTKIFPKEELYGLVSQLRRCSIFVPSNIAERCGRQTPKDTIHFLYISRGSLYELEQVLKQIETTKKLLNSFN